MNDMQEVAFSVSENGERIGNEVGWVIYREKKKGIPSSYYKSDDGFIHFSSDIKNAKIFGPFLDALRARDKLAFPKEAFAAYFNGYTICGRY